MATADQVKALIRSHAEGDDARFYAVAMQVAAQAARSGHGKFAVELRELVDKVKAQSGDARGRTALKAVPLAQPRGELTGLLTVGYPKTRGVYFFDEFDALMRLASPVWSEPVKDRV